MKCPKCGTENAENAKFCTSCGTDLGGAQTNQSNQTNSNSFEQNVASLNNTHDYTHGFDRADIEQNKTLALFSYLGLLFLIPMLGAPNSPYARFHVNQGLALFIVEIIYGVASSIINYIFGNVLFIGWIVSIALWLLSLGLAALAIIGIVNAVQGKAKELPIIGSIRIIK